jgi:hypothetical protein
MHAIVMFILCLKATGDSSEKFTDEKDVKL